MAKKKCKCDLIEVTAGKAKSYGALLKCTKCKTYYEWVGYFQRLKSPQDI